VSTTEDPSVTNAETRAVLTLDGEVRITFGEEGRNTIDGSAEAVVAFERALLLQVNRYGIGVTPESLQPDDLHFVAGPGSGLILGDPPELDEEDPPPMPADDDEGSEPTPPPITTPPPALPVETDPPPTVAMDSAAVEKARQLDEARARLATLKELRELLK
jgi:hypothetical protein